MNRLIALIPAAGVGQRFGANVPKQYSCLHGKTVLAHTVERFAQHSAIDGIIVVVSPDDAYIDDVVLPSEKLGVYHCGGLSRAESVRNGILAALDDGCVDEQDWLLVHDAARCCLPVDALNRLIHQVRTHEVGGLLAVPVVDTVKRASVHHLVEETVSRQHLWLAQTPQMFRVSLLLEALAGDLTNITDEASAVEQLGHQPLLVEGDVCNLKLTRPQDAILAAAFLECAAQGE